MNKIKLSGLALACALSFGALPAQADVMVGGAAMYPTKDIIDNAVNSKDLRPSSPQSRPRDWWRR